MEGKKHAKLGTAVGAMYATGTLGGNFLDSQSFPTGFLIYSPLIALFWVLWKNRIEIYRAVPEIEKERTITFWTRLKDFTSLDQTTKKLIFLSNYQSFLFRIWMNCLESQYLSDSQMLLLSSCSQKSPKTLLKSSEKFRKWWSQQVTGILISWGYARLRQRIMALRWFCFAACSIAYFVLRGECINSKAQLCTLFDPLKIAELI